MSTPSAPAPNFRYRLDKEWSQADPAKSRVNDRHAAAEAASLLASGRAKTKPTAERAAAIMVASLILNLDEAITHE